MEIEFNDEVAGIRAGRPHLCMMNDNQTRTALFAALLELTNVVPEMRAGQLMAAIGELCADLHGRGLWDAADAELLEAVWRFRRNIEAAMTNTLRQS